MFSKEGREALSNKMTFVHTCKTERWSLADIKVENIKSSPKENEF